jgi:ferredoxin-NADP reductase
MKIIVHLFVFMLLAMSVQAQEKTAHTLKVGDILVIDKPAANNYVHIDLPKENIILKQGGTANYESLYLSTVEVVRVKEKKDGSFEVVLKRTDGKQFFNAFPTIEAKVPDALSSGELRKQS